jgi:pyrrolidone-carboxylate peptidase
VGIEGMQTGIYSIETPGGWQLIGRTPEALFRPNESSMVICVSQAEGRSTIPPERIAINMDDASITDNENNQPIDEEIVQEGPAAYFSKPPIKAMVKK